MRRPVAEAVPDRHEPDTTRSGRLHGNRGIDGGLHAAPPITLTSR
ncbi:hypothetical protein [Streptomyces flaveus]